MAEEEEFSQLPLPDQFTHKNWKARKGGYETATKEFKIAPPDSPLVREFIFDSNLWKGAVGDSNVAAQQEALNAYNAFLDAAGTEGARKTRSATVTPIVEKGLNGRPAAKAAAMESLLLLIELDRADPIVEDLLPFLSHKLPKLVTATLWALTSIYHAYGCKTVEPKPVLKLLPKVFGHADKNVRAEAQNLTVELYRWLREAMKPLFWGELKEVQQKDLDKLFEPVKAEPNPKQERLLRSQQAIQEQAEATATTAGGEGDDDDDGGEIDLEPEHEAVDVLPKIPKDLGERLGSAKWKDRKEVLDEVFTVVNVPAIKEGPFDDLVRGCAKSMKDANIAVVTVAANIIECLAKGLRNAFSRYRSTILAPMLERFKEKKIAVTDAIGAACDAIFLATSFGDIQMDVLEALKNKNPQVKENTAKFLARAVKTTRQAPSLEQTKEFAEASKKLLSESAAPLRDAGCEVLGVMWKVMGDRNMLAHLEGLDDIKKNKIKEFCDTAEVKTKWKPKAAPAAKAAAPSATAKKPVLGSKRPAAPGVKKAAPPPKAVTPPSPPPPAVEDTPLQPRPTSRPVGKGPSALKLPGSGLKAPTGLQKPGLKPPTTVTSSTASPKRQGMVFDETAPIVAAPKLGAPGVGRGLAARPLAKPAATPASPPPASRSEMDPPSAMSSIERQELSDLRDEVESLRNQCSDLRQDKLRLSSQINELSNQNAQLIEDHTRDVLQIKAKETQLVRARSDAESAEDRANSLSKEIDRLKREMSRLNRAQSTGRDSPIDPHHAGLNGDYSATRPNYNGNRHSYTVPSARAYPSESVEATQPSHATRPYSNGSSGRATPASLDDGLNTSNGSSTLGSTRPPAAAAAATEGQESWRRAAEVTQNLKARIEMMKARQNLGRGQ